MIFTETPLSRAFVIDLERNEDERGFFARTWDQDVFEQEGLNPALMQCNISFNKKIGTLRGMHFQAVPYQEVKLVRCTMGAIFDVIIDLHLDSPTFRHWFGLELSAENRRMLYIPEDFAHGFLTLKADTEVFYQMSARYLPECACGVRWDDPAFGIVWPAGDKVISDRDQSFPNFRL